MSTHVNLQLDQHALTCIPDEPFNDVAMEGIFLNIISSYVAGTRTALDPVLKKCGHFYG